MIAVAETTAYTIEAGKVEYTLIFNFCGDFTFVNVAWPDKPRPGRPWPYAGVSGYAKRHPKDEYNRAVAMRQAMRRACGMHSLWGQKLPELWHEFRLMQMREEEQATH